MLRPGSNLKRHTLKTLTKDIHMKNTLLFLDCETNTLKSPRLVQLAWSQDDKDIQDILVKPPTPIEFWAMAVHHVTNEMVEDLPPFEWSWYKENISAMFNHMILVFHNASFDLKVLANEGIEAPERHICTYKVAYTLYDLEQHTLQYLRYALDLDKIVTKFWYTKEIVPHTAESDVIILKALYQKLLEDTSLENMLAISAKPILFRRMPLGKHKGVDFKAVPKDYLAWCINNMDFEQSNGENLKYTINYYLRNI